MISMEEKIAIVIPAYKCRFLRQTLDSIVVQTCRSFTVYIGDDASPLWGIERSGFFNDRGKWAKGFENQRV